MISVNDAIGRILHTTKALESIEISISEALGYSLSEDISSPIDMPPFDNSAFRPELMQPKSFCNRDRQRGSLREPWFLNPQHR
jgi:hypothetical protein